MSLDNQLDVSGPELKPVIITWNEQQTLQWIMTLKTTKQHLHMVAKHPLRVQSQGT